MGGCMHLWVTHTQDLYIFCSQLAVLSWPWTWREDPCETNACSVCQACEINRSAFQCNVMGVLTPLHVSDLGKRLEGLSGSCRRGPLQMQYSFGVGLI